MCLVVLCHRQQWHGLQRSGCSPRARGPGAHAARMQTRVRAWCARRAPCRDPPNREQVRHVFKHLDLNNDLGVSRDELEVFLKHL